MKKREERGKKTRREGRKGEGRRADNQCGTSTRRGGKSHTEKKTQGRFGIRKSPCHKNQEGRAISERKYCDLLIVAFIS